MKKQFCGGVFLLLAVVSNIAGAETNTVAQEVAPVPIAQGATVLSKTPLIARIGNLSRFAGYRVTYQYEGKPYTVLIIDEKSIKNVEYVKKQKSIDNSRT